MPSFATILTTLSGFLSFIPVGSPFRSFLETLIQIVTFAVQFQPPT